VIGSLSGRLPHLAGMVIERIDRVDGVAGDLRVCARECRNLSELRRTVWPRA